MNKRLYLNFRSLTFIIIILLCSYPIFAKPTLQKLEIDSLNHIVFSFDQVPPYSVILDSSKIDLKIEFKNTFISNQVNTIDNRGIFQRINYSSKDSILIVNIKLKEKSGYTSLVEPYSQRIVLNIFNWANLQKSEDLFHTGLLALEDSLYNVAEKYLLQSTMLGNPKASAILSGIYSNQKKIHRADKYSEYGKSEVYYFPDIYNILANISKYKSDSVNFSKYKNEFQRITGKQFVPINFSSNLPSDTLSASEYHTMDSLISAYQSQLQSESSNGDLSRFNKIFDGNNTVKKDSIPQQRSSWNALPLWMKAIIGLIITFLVILVFQYFRWRNIQAKIKVEKLKEQAKKDAKQSAKQTQNPSSTSTIPSQMMSAYIQNEPPKPEATPPQQTPQPTPTSLDITEEKVKQLSGILENIKASKEEESQKKIKLSQPPLSAKLELALNLAEEQKRLKQEKVLQTSPDFYTTGEKLKTTAKKLGLEENTIEIKQAIANLINDKSKLQEMQSKLESKSPEK